MEQLHFLFGEDYSVVYDPFIANRLGDILHLEIIVSIRLNDLKIKNLSSFVWETYIGILNEYRDMDFDYFEENDDEPYPYSKETITENPLLLDEYFRKSILWRDTILENFLFKISAEPKKYFIAKYKDCFMENSDLILSFYVVNNREVL